MDIDLFAPGPRLSTLGWSGLDLLPDDMGENLNSPTRAQNADMANWGRQITNHASRRNARPSGALIQWRPICGKRQGGPSSELAPTSPSSQI